MKVWIVKETYSYGEYESQRCAGVFSSEEKAEAFCQKQNAKETSSYSNFEVQDCFVVDQET